MKKEYKVNYSGIIDTLELNVTRKALLKSAWLDYLLLLEKSAGRGWLMSTTCQLLIFVFGIFIPLIDSTLLNADVWHTGLKVVGLLGTLIAVFTFLTRLLGFDRKWIHYRKHTELVRNEGDDYLALSGI